ncbi:ankyrin repeat and SAM domain-containing protein 6-like [Populus alba x Populus x berolinensis]|nr:ankyrin repeat and SAM domain-containing protein 6-like [Populus alba x Populus x berolinensis]
MYADRVDSAAKTSIKDRLNGNSVADSSRRRQITGKRQRLDDKWEHDLYEDNGPRVSNRKIDAQDLRLKLQRRSLLQASPGSGADLREKLYGTMNSQPVNADLPKIAVAKPSRKSVAVEAPEPEIKKITSVASRKRSQQKVDKVLPSLYFKLKKEQVGMALL